MRVWTERLVLDAESTVLDPASRRHWATLRQATKRHAQPLSYAFACQLIGYTQTLAPSCQVNVCKCSNLLGYEWVFACFDHISAVFGIRRRSCKGQHEDRQHAKDIIPPFLQGETSIPPPLTPQIWGASAQEVHYTPQFCREGKHKWVGDI